MPTRENQRKKNHGSIILSWSLMLIIIIIASFALINGINASNNESDMRVHDVSYKFLHEQIHKHNIKRLIVHKNRASATYKTPPFSQSFSNKSVTNVQNHKIKEIL